MDDANVKRWLNDLSFGIVNLVSEVDTFICYELFLHITLHYYYFTIICGVNLFNLADDLNLMEKSIKTN